MLAVSKGSAIAGTTVCSAGWRTIDDPASLSAGEIALDTLPDSPCWDMALNGGSGGVRSLTSAEISAEQSAQAAAANQQVTDLSTVQAFMTGGSNQSTAAITGTLQAMIRLQGF